MNICCHQVNLQTGWGGGEVYTVFFTRALVRLGVPTILYINRHNRHWAGRLPDGATVVSVDDESRITERFGEDDSGWFLFHSPLLPSQLAKIRAPGRLLSCIAHMPLYGRNPDRIAAHDYVIGVSDHVLDSLRSACIENYHREPLFGIADFSDRKTSSPAIIERHSRYDWDLRKGRDRLLSWLYPPVEKLLPVRTYTKKNRIALGIVSRITPIKQFPLLFRYLAPVIARHPEFCVEIFGAGGYASVRDLDRALAPIKSSVRFWGHQENVGEVYESIDYLLTGLPEKEALGLNVIEAQYAGTPVLAVDSKPFTETVADEVTGRVYADPRGDNGADFDRLLGELSLHPFAIDPLRAHDHLQQFSEASFDARVGRLCGEVGIKLNHENTCNTSR